MIYKQWLDILEGLKSRTRRAVGDDEEALWNGVWIPPALAVGKEHISEVAKIDHMYWVPRARTKWRVGSSYAVVPKRGAGSIYYKRDRHGGLSIWDYASLPTPRPRNVKAFAEGEGWTQQRIRVLEIRVERLQDITEADAVLEGFTAVPLSQTLKPAYRTRIMPGHISPTARDGYAALWDSINGKTPGLRWVDNPLVWVLAFEGNG